MPDKIQKLDFDLDFQRVLVKQSIESPEWLAQYREFMDPSALDSRELETIAKVVIEFYDKNDTSPEAAVLADIVRRRFKGEMRNLLLEEVETILDIAPKKGTIQYVSEHLRDFSENQTWKRAITEGALALSEGRIPDVRKTMDTALTFGETVSRNDVFFFEETGDVAHLDALNDPTQRIATMWKTLDEKTRGGPSRKELAMFLGPPARGKSVSLVNVGTAGLMTGANVLHVTVEMSARKTQYRYGSRLTGMTIDQIALNQKLYLSKIEKFKSLYKGRLIIKEWPGRTASVDDIIKYAKMLARRYDFFTDMIVLDYIDELKRPRGDNLSYAIGDNVAYFRGMAMKHNFLGWTATQTTRAGFSKTRLDMDDVADSWDKMKVSDLVIAICQTPEEADREMMRYIIIKNRDNKRFSRAINLQTKFDQMLLKEI